MTFYKYYIIISSSCSSLKLKFSYKYNHFIVIFNKWKRSNCDGFLDEHIKKQKITVEVKHLDDNGNIVYGIVGDFVVVIGDGGGVKNLTYTSNKNV